MIGCSSPLRAAHGWQREGIATPLLLPEAEFRRSLDAFPLEYAEILRAHDVIHSFFVPSMRFKQDAVPGLAIHMHFTPIATGDYEIACAELCGLGHYKMHGILKVVSEEEYNKWLTAREAEKQ